MDVPVHDFPRVYRPGFHNTMITAEKIAVAKYTAHRSTCAAAPDGQLPSCRSSH
jgi:hypothetical protein